MAGETFIAVDQDALYSKSKVYIARALKRKASKELEEYQLWASLALELLGKSALARKHPSLVVDPTHWQSLFVAAGLNVTTDVKTITAKTLFERLAHLLPRFNSNIQSFCHAISQRRNAELHSGDLPFSTMRLEGWESRYWYACDTILRWRESTLEEWLGAQDAAAPVLLLEEASEALKAAVVLRVENAKAEFDALKKAEREQMRVRAELLQPQHQAEIFERRYDEVWTASCPSCECRAFMSGLQISEEIRPEYEEDGAWEMVTREFAGEEFICPSCELALMGADEIEAAGLDNLHTEEQEREMEYEPDYGND